MRGVVVVPSRELARQVHAVFEALKPEMEDIPMRICLAAGQPDEQVLIEPNWDLIPPSRPAAPGGGQVGLLAAPQVPLPRPRARGGPRARAARWYCGWPVRRDRSYSR